MNIHKERVEEGIDRRTLHSKARDCLATCTSAGSDVDHARLFALGAVCGLLLTSVGKIGLSASTKTLSRSGTHIGHVISLAPAKHWESGRESDWGQATLECESDKSLPRVKQGPPAAMRSEQQVSFHWGDKRLET